MNNTTNKDLHAETAAKMFSVDIADVTPEQRRAGKAINFGLIYGMATAGQPKLLKEEFKK